MTHLPDPDKLPVSSDMGATAYAIIGLSQDNYQYRPCYGQASDLPRAKQDKAYLKTENCKCPHPHNSVLLGLDQLYIWK